MVTEVSSKTELAALATKLSTQATELTASVDALVSAIGSASDYDGINVTGAANILKSNLETILADLEVVAANILAYSNELNNLDTNDNDEEVYRIDISQNDDGIDTENRIEKFRTLYDSIKKLDTSNEINQQVLDIQKAISSYENGNPVPAGNGRNTEGHRSYFRWS